MSKINPSLNDDGIMLCGYQKKLKTMKKKFFVLYKDTMCNTSRLEYYDNEKKFRSGQGPKRVIKLKHCFNINRRLDTKHNYVIVLSSKDGGFGLVLESENEMTKWLNALMRCNEISMSNFDHVWQVQVQKKGLAEQKGILGNYHICLSRKSVTFIRIGLDKSSSGEARMSTIEFLLTTVRRCGDSQSFFYMEVGRQSIIGPGELWMETEDALVAQNMHKLILSAMTTMFEEPMRKRSSSANEASKPINLLHKRQNLEETNANSPLSNKYYGRDRCDSLPTRNRTSVDCNNQSTASLSTRNSTLTHSRSHFYQQESAPMNYNVGCSESEESSISFDEFDDNACFPPFRYNHRSEKVIPEENQDDLINSDIKRSSNDYMRDVSYVSMSPDSSTPIPVRLGLSSYYHKHHELPENISASDYQNELDMQFEIPKRTYSIGSKDEHNQTNKCANNAASHDHNIRVRAFSVGSRAKIPRCDLQRGVLFPRTKVEQKFNSNNNISTDVLINNHASILNVSSEKKSNSAPLLIHKSLNSVDVMSDLMEIDFSKTTNLAEKRLRQQEKSKKNSNSLMSSCENNLNTNVRSENGYLEMKPVSSTLKSVVKGINENGMDITESSNRVPINKETNYSSAPKSFKLLDEFLAQNDVAALSSNMQNTKVMENASINGIKKSSDQDVLTKLNVLKINAEDTDDYINIKNSTILSYPDNIYEVENCNVLLQHKENLLVGSNEIQPENIIMDQPKKPCNLNTVKLPSTPSTPSISTLESASVKFGSLNAASVSSCSDQLHYASLDLPQLNNDVNTKVKTKELALENKKACQSSTNSYAKIDFDHSDSSSSSSKNHNM